MRRLTEGQWARYSALCARLRPLAVSEQAAALQALRATGDDEPQVLSLVAIHLALPPEPDRLRTGERLGNFTLEEPLGAGGMGVVYRAQQHLGPARRAVALKLIHPTFLQVARDEAMAHFLAELHTLVTLQHEHIARIYDGGIYEDPRTHEALPFLAMELVRGGLPLTTYVRDYALAWPERLALFLRVCRAVEYAHEHRVVHRDLKPANLLVDQDGRPFVIDFGLAHVCDAALSGAQPAASGTPAYMSPEQVSEAFGAISEKSDVYALGLILFELLTDQPAYVLPHDGSLAQLCQVITAVEPPPLHYFNTVYGQELEESLALALAKRPAERIAVAVLRFRLERSLQQLASASPRPAHQARRALQHRQPIPRRGACGRVAHDARPWTGQGRKPAMAATPGGPPMAGPMMSEAGRRQLTVMCCEVTEAASGFQRCDPEDLQELVQAYQATCSSVLERFAGTIIQHRGMHLLACFGYPQAHEDAAYRAVRASLALVQALAEQHRHCRRDQPLRFAARVGLHTGLIVVQAQDEETARDLIAGGAPAHVAEYIQRLAAPDTVVLSAATAALVQGLFVSRELAVPPEWATVLPTPLVQVVRESQAHNRFDVVRGCGLAPLVGRHEELGLLRQRWEQACQGHGQGVLLYGEAGIGKSRLVEALREHVEPQAQAWVTLRCTSMTQQSALYPVLAFLRQRLPGSQEATSDTRLPALEALLQGCGLPVHAAVPLVAPLLAMPLAGRYRPVPLPPDVQRRKTLEVLLTWLLRGAVSTPAVLVWEDLHWADPSTVALLSLLLEQLPTLPVLVLCTCRPSFQPPWPLRSYLMPLALDRLHRDHVVEMIAQAAGGIPVPSEVTQEVLHKSDGVPLFVEELMSLILQTQVVRQEHGRYVLAKPLTELAIPSTLHDLLMARLDRLGPALGMLQLGAMLGREFSYRLLQAVVPLGTAELQQGLTRLREAELLHQQGLPPQATYVFKHALIQEAAYQSLRQRRRRHHHQRIARVLETQFPDIAEQQPELLARHYTEAQQPSQAVAYWQQASQAALRQLASVEAIRHAHAGLALLATMPTTAASLQHELRFQSTLGMAYTATKGFAASEVEQAYGRALALCQQVGEGAPLPAILGGLRTFYFARGELQTARALAEQQLGLAQRQHQAPLLIQAYTNLGIVLFYLGALREAQDALQQGWQLLASLDTYTVSEIRDSRVNCLSHMALALLLGGQAEQAVACGQEALTLARALAHPFSLAYAFGMTALLHLIRREPHDTQRYAEAALALAREHGFASFVATGEIVRGFALMAQGHDTREDVTALHQAIARRRASGTEVLGVLLLLCLAEAYGQAGHSTAGLRVLDEAQEAMASREEYAFQAEWHRIRGELLLQQALPEVTQAEACLQQALEVARRQHARWWELRAATRLCQVWQQQGQRDAAAQLLGEVCDGFTEGFDTVDLREARALLAALGVDLPSPLCKGGNPADMAVHEALHNKATLVRRGGSDAV